MKRLYMTLVLTAGFIAPVMSMEQFNFDDDSNEAISFDFALQQAPKVAEIYASDRQVTELYLTVGLVEALNQLKRENRLTLGAIASKWQESILLRTPLRDLNRTFQQDRVLRTIKDILKAGSTPGNQQRPISVREYNQMAQAMMNLNVRSQERNAPNQLPIVRSQTITLEESCEKVTQAVINAIEKLSAAEQTPLNKRLIQILSTSVDGLSNKMQEAFLVRSNGRLTLPADQIYDIAFQIVQDFCSNYGLEINKIPALVGVLDIFLVESSEPKAVTDQPAIQQPVSRQETKKEEKNDDCPVCMEPMTRSFAGWQCMHKLCKSCCDKVRTTQGKCPECRNKKMLDDPMELKKKK